MSTFAPSASRPGRGLWVADCLAHTPPWLRGAWILAAGVCSFVAFPVAIGLVAVALPVMAAGLARQWVREATPWPRLGLVCTELCLAATFVGYPLYNRIEFGAPWPHELFGYVLCATRLLGAAVLVGLTRREPADSPLLSAWRDEPDPGFEPELGVALGVLCAVLAVLAAVALLS